MYCPNCGQRTADTALFCTNCGTKLPRPASTLAGAALPPVPVKLVGEPGLPPVPVKLVGDEANLPPAPVRLADDAPVPVKLVDEPVPVKLVEDMPAQKAPGAPQAEAESLEDIQEAIKPPEKDVFRIRFGVQIGQPFLEVQAPGAKKPITAPFNAPYDTAGRATLLAQLQEGAQATPQIAGLHQQTGAALLASLFPDPAIRKELARAAESAFSRHKPLTVQMRFDSNAVEQAQLPWELLYDGNHHLSLAEDIHLNRYVTFFGDRQPFKPVEPVRVLFVIARPNDQADLPLYERDAMVQELRRLANLGKVEITILEQATFANFALEAQTGKFHIVHFDGHGSFEGEGLLCFENPAGGTDPVSASQMAQALQDSGVRLVVLSACMSATVGGNSVFNSTAPALIRAKIPAVVAHQFSVPFTASLAFVKAFYNAIGHGASISAAVADGRQAIAQDPQAPAVWFYPVLYLRSATGDGYFFSESPLDDLELALGDLAQMTLEWAHQTLEDQLLYPEGRPTWQGGEITPDNYLDLLDALIPPTLPQSVDIPEVGEMLLIPAGEVTLGSSEEQIQQLETKVDRAAEKYLDKVCEDVRAITLEIYGKQMTEEEARESAEDMEGDTIQTAVQQMKETLKLETPQHTVFLEDYYIARQPLSFRQWWAFVQDGGYRRKEFWEQRRWEEMTQGDLAIQQMLSQEDRIKYYHAFDPTLSGTFGFSLVVEQQMWNLRKEYARKMASNPGTTTPMEGGASEWQAYLNGVEQITRGITDPANGNLLCPWFRWLGWISGYWASIPLTLAPKAANEQPKKIRFPGYPDIGKEVGREFSPASLPTVQRCLELNPTMPVYYEEAVAFCKWASQKSIERHGEHAALFFLPFEAEWEKAARGTDGRIYPWGDEFRTEIANAQNGYAAAASPYGVEGMCCGNLHDDLHVYRTGVQYREPLQSSAEWTGSEYKAYPLDNNTIHARNFGTGMIRGDDQAVFSLADTRAITCRCAGIRTFLTLDRSRMARVRVASHATGALRRIKLEE